MTNTRLLIIVVSKKIYARQINQYSSQNITLKHIIYGVNICHQSHDIIMIDKSGKKSLIVNPIAILNMCFFSLMKIGKVKHQTDQ